MAKLEQGSVARRKAIEKVRRLIGKNYTDEEICEQLCYTSKTLLSLKQEILNTDRILFEHIDSAGVYSDYLGKSKQMIKKLHNMSVAFKGRSQGAAFVQAIKMEKDIYDSVIKLGQDLGFVEKKAAEMEIKGEMTFSNLTDEQMREEIEKEVNELNKLAMGGKVIQMRPELLASIGEDPKTFVPAGHVKKKKKKKQKVVVKTKIRLRKNV